MSGRRCRRCYNLRAWCTCAGGRQRARRRIRTHGGIWHERQDDHWPVPRRRGVAVRFRAPRKTWLR